MASKRVIIFLGVLIFVPLASYFAIRFARGERLNPQTGTLTSTGLLVAASVPEGASVFVDGKLKTATDDTINLAPGEYEVEIKKDGFHSWQKHLRIEKELVTKTDVYLFSSFPSLKSLTRTGAADPVISPDSQKIVFSVATASAGKRGLWLLDISGRVLGLSHEPRQIIESAPRGRDFSQGTCQWSPDSKEIIVALEEENFLLSADKLNDPIELVDITPNLDFILAQWEKEKTLRQEEQISKLPNKLLEAVEGSIDNIAFSPDEKMIFYTATASATIPQNIKTPLPATNSQPEERQIKPGKIYVYDLTEDKNFFIMDEEKPSAISHQSSATTPKALSWFPTSRHLFFVRENKVTIFEYDNTNWVDVYTGAFENGFAFPFPSADNILILASLGENQPPNLYAVSLR